MSLDYSEVHSKRTMELTNLGKKKPNKKTTKSKNKFALIHSRVARLRNVENGRNKKNGIKRITVLLGGGGEVADLQLPPPPGRGGGGGWNCRGQREESLLNTQKKPNQCP